MLCRAAWGGPGGGVGGDGGKSKVDEHNDEVTRASRVDELMEMVHGMQGGSRMFQDEEELPKTRRRPVGFLMGKRGGEDAN